MSATLEREKRLEAISLADTETLVGLADQVLESLEVTVSRGPTIGLLMGPGRGALGATAVQLRRGDSLRSRSCRPGPARVRDGEGRQPEKALAGAILDAAMETGHPHSAVIDGELRQAIDREQQRKQAAWARVAPTAVRFDEMAP